MRATSGRIWSIALLTVAVGAFRLAPAFAADDVLIEISAGKRDREQSVVSVELPERARGWTGYRLVAKQSQRGVTCQRDDLASPPRLVWLLESPLNAGEKRTYHLSETTADTDATPLGVRAAEADGKLQIDVGRQPALVYHLAVVPSADPKEPAFQRSGFIHPVYDPSGAVVTDDQPPDHFHQHGLMLAWVDTTFAGRHVDFWNSAKHEGLVRHKELLSKASGPVLGGFTARLEHVDLTAPGGEVTALSETWTVRVYNRGDGFLFDLQSRETCATDKPLVVNKYDYGGMATRGARDWLGEGKCDFLTSEGKTRGDGNHTKAHWCDISGPLSGKPHGLAVLCDAANFRAPQPVRLHPDKPYFCFAPMVAEPFTIEPGKPYVSRYRFFAHKGQPDPQAIDALWNDYAQPIDAVVR